MDWWIDGGGGRKLNGSGLELEEELEEEAMMATGIGLFIVEVECLGFERDEDGLDMPETVD